MANEAPLMRKMQMKASEIGARLFRNTIGFCECRGRKIRYGVGGKGGSDLLGWTPITITPQMVGRTIAVFVAVEVKDGSPTTKEQMQFLQAVIRAGGVGLIANSTAGLDVLK